ncbi:hypothetical protein CsSME_00026314 [Camellia sinensis var. sinensis]
MELLKAVRHIVDEVGFGPFCMRLSRHPVSRTLLGALVERWWDTTNSFHFSATGNMKMTPYDFSILMGFNVVGRPIPYDTDMGEWEAAWTYLLGAHPPPCRSPGMVRYTWFAEQYRGTTPETIEAIQQYAWGFLMFLLGTTLFSDRGNTVGLYLLSALVDLKQLCVYAYFSILAPELEVEAHFEIPYSRRFEGRCWPRPRETLLYLRQYFDTVRATEITWQPWLAMPWYSRFQFAGTMGNPTQEISSTPPLDMRSTESLTLREVDDVMLGVDAVLFLEEGEYATYRHTYLMAGTSRGGARGIPPTCQYVGWPDLPTELTGWQYGTSYPIPLEPPLLDHRYISDPDSPPPPREDTEGLLGVVASLESMVLWREMLLSHRFRPGHPGLLEQLREGFRLAADGDVDLRPDRMTSPARRRSQRILSQRYLQAEMTTSVPVLRAEVTPRRILGMATPIQMVVPTVVVQRLLKRRG